MLRQDSRFLPEEFFDLTDFVFPELFSYEPIWITVSKVNSFLTSLFETKKVKGNYSENVYIEDNVEIDSTAKIIGPVIICSGARVGFNSLVRGSVIIGKNSTIGHAVEIKNSVVLNNSSVPHFNYVGDSIIGSNVNIGAGTITANLRLDKKTVPINLNRSKKIETDLRKLGSIIGDESNIGAHVVLNPGTILAKKTFVYPLLNISGYNFGTVKNK